MTRGQSNRGFSGLDDVIDEQLPEGFHCVYDGEQDRFLYTRAVANSGQSSSYAFHDKWLSQFLAMAYTSEYGFVALRQLRSIGWLFDGLSTLSEPCRDYLGRTLLFEPFYGWGWRMLDSDEPQLDDSGAAGPRPFHARVTGFFDKGGSTIGAVATIEEPGHSHDSLRVVFSPSNAGSFDFTGHVGDFRLAIGPELDRGDPPCATGLGALAGWSRVRDDRWADGAL